MTEGDFLTRAGAFLIPDIDCSLPGGNPLATALRTVRRVRRRVFLARAVCIAGHYFYSVSFEPTLALSTRAASSQTRPSRMQ